MRERSSSHVAVEGERTSGEVEAASRGRDAVVDDKEPGVCWSLR